MPASPLSPRTTPWLALFAAAAGAIAFLWVVWCTFPCITWNEIRLAPAFALRHGINPYPPLGGGPLFTWIYGPVRLVLDLPATFATSPLAALHVASLITALLILGPLAVVFSRSEDLRARGTWAPWLALALGVLWLPETQFLFQVPDQSAIAFGLLSGWCLARQPRPGTAQLASAGVLCALAIFSKQPAVFLVVAQLIFLWHVSDRRTAFRYLAWVALFVGLGLALCLPVFGATNLWFNLVVIPARLPWAEFAARLATRPWALVAQVSLPSLALLALWLTKRWPGRTTESGRFFHFTALAYVIMLPVGLAAFFKIGGDINALHSWNYLLPGLLLLWLSTDRGPAASPALLLGVTALALALHGRNYSALPRQTFSAHFAVAAHLNAAYPQAIWFPQNPIISYYADGRIWNSEDGVRTRIFAGYLPREAEFRHDLPPQLQAIAYPLYENYSLSTALLPEFSQKTELPHWLLLTRPMPTATP